MIIETEKLKSMVSKVSKGATFNSFIPITGMCEIECDGGIDGGVLTISTTDGISRFSVHSEIVGTDDFVVVVDANVLFSLVQKISTDNIKITCDDNIIKVCGNGTYKIPIEKDGSEKVLLPNTDKLFHAPETNSIYADNIKDVIKCHSASLPDKSQQKEKAALNGYYFDNSCIATTNSITIAVTDHKIFNSPVMLSKEYVELLTTFEDCIMYEYEDGYFLFIDDDTSLWCKAMTEVDDYPIKSIMAVCGNAEKNLNFVTVNRADLINSIDRMNLFTSNYDNSSMCIEMSDGYMYCKSKNDSAVDRISVDGKVVDAKFNINSNILKAQLKSSSNVSISFGYGSNKFIELKDETTIRIIALQED